MILRPIFEKLFKFRETVSRQNKARPGADDGYDPHEKPFLDHLEDLRRTLMKICGSLAITTILGFAFHKQIFHTVLLPLSLPLAELKDGDGNAIGYLIQYIHFIVLSPPEILVLSIKVSFFAGLVGAFPLLVFFLGEFVLPGLRQQEKKLVIPGIGIGFVLFIIGGSFAFFFAVPVAMKFFYEFGKERIGFVHPNLTEERTYVPITIAGSDKTVSAADIVSGGVDSLTGDTSVSPPTVVEPTDAGAEPLADDLRDSIRDYLLDLIVVEQGSTVSITYLENDGKLAISTGTRDKTEYRIGEYISFVTRLILVFGISFQLPVVVTILAKLQLLTARVMRATRSFAWVIILVLAAIFTPPDVFTLALLGGPMILLYEVCIWIAWGIERNRDKARRKEESAERDRLGTLYSKPADELSEEEKAEMHKRDIEQYERDHAHLDDHHLDDHHLNEHDDPESESFGHDPHAIGYDPGHDEGWHDDHGHEQSHDDPYHQPDHDDDVLDPHQQHDPHENAEADRPAQDWSDVDEAGDQSFGSEVESDHVEPADSSEPSSSGNGGNDESTDDKGSPQACEPSGGIVNPNVATLEDLIALPGVDEELADHILLYRPFDNFDELLEVPGMDEQLLNEFIDRIVLE